MKMAHRKASLLGMGALLVCGGVGIGALASSLTTSAMVWSPSSRIPITEAPVDVAVDQGRAGQSWARAAFPGGLRRCPALNAAFLRACEAEIKALAERPAFAAGSYGGPLLITKVEPVSVEPDYAEEMSDFAPARHDASVQATVSDLPKLVLPDLDETPRDYPAMTPESPSAFAEAGHPLGYDGLDPGR